jgi:hypothetical protein
MANDALALSFLCRMTNDYLAPSRPSPAATSAMLACPVPAVLPRMTNDYLAPSFPPPPCPLE